jgi:hypothetical protein
MQRLFLLYANLILGLFGSHSLFAQTTFSLTLKKAIDQKMVLVDATHNEGSVHFIKPVILSLTSRHLKPLKLILEAGDVMEPEDSNYQTMMLMEGLTITLYPNKPLNIQPNAMCIEPSDMAGKKNLKYFFKANGNQKLIDIAKYIYLNRFEASVAQQAVWCVADTSHSLLNINGYNTQNRDKLIESVAFITGKKMPSTQEIVVSHQNYIAQPEETIGGMFEFNFLKSKKVLIAMFDSNGVIVRELYYNDHEKSGLQQVRFEFDYTLYTDAYYEIKLIADEKVCLSTRVDRNDENWIDD